MLNGHDVRRRKEEEETAKSLYPKPLIKSNENPTETRVVTIHRICRPHLLP